MPRPFRAECRPPAARAVPPRAAIDTVYWTHSLHRSAALAALLRATLQLHSLTHTQLRIFATQRKRSIRDWERRKVVRFGGTWGSTWGRGCRLVVASCSQERRGGAAMSPRAARVRVASADHTAPTYCRVSPDPDPPPPSPPPAVAARAPHACVMRPTHDATDLRTNTTGNNKTMKASTRFTQG